MRAALLERLVIIILKLILPYLKRKVLTTETKADDVIVKILEDLTKPITDESTNRGKSI